MIGESRLATAHHVITQTIVASCNKRPRVVRRANGCDRGSNCLRLCGVAVRHDSFITFTFRRRPVRLPDRDRLVSVAAPLYPRLRETSCSTPELRRATLCQRQVARALVRYDVRRNVDLQVRDLFVYSIASAHVITALQTRPSARGPVTCVQLT